MNTKQDGKCAYEVILRRVTIISSEYVFVAFRYIARNAHAPYYYLLPVWHYNIFPHYLIKGKILEKKIIEQTMCFEFLYNFALNSSNSETKWERYDKKYTFIFTYNTSYSCQILMKIEFYLKIFDKMLKYQISWKSVRWESRVLPCGRTDRHDETKSSSSSSSSSSSCSWRMNELLG
jgi:hypothetical protein